MYSPYRKQKYKSPFMNKMHERFIRTRKKFKTLVNRFMEKGHERLTMMLIPHSEKKIFNFQISNFTIAFFVVVLVVIVVFSIISLNDHETSQTQISKLSNLSKNREGQIMAFKKRTNFTTRNFVRFEKQIKHLAASIGVDKKTFILPHYSRGGVDYSVNSEMRKKYGKNFSFPEEIKELDRLNNNVMRSTDQLTRINSFMDNLKQVMNYTPSLWPVAGGGFITSRYGYRASPYLVFIPVWILHGGPVPTLKVPLPELFVLYVLWADTDFVLLSPTVMVLQQDTLICKLPELVLAAQSAKAKSSAPWVIPDEQPVTICIMK